MKIAVAAFAALASTAACAGDLNNIGSLSQDEFGQLVRDLGAAFSYKGVTPATPLGALGFDMGVEVSDTRVENGDVMQRAGGSSSDIVVPKLHFTKGLPARFDIGAFVGGSTSLNATVLGGELRYAFLDDTLTTPALAVRLAGTHTSGMGDLRLYTVSLDAMVSKRLAVFTPYAGIGTVRVSASPKNTDLSDETLNRGRGFIGAQFNFIGTNVAFEAERMGSNTSLSAKLGFRF
ncbi:MAG TPA: hypothetical protein VFE23_08660 [Usitatibacter sp.]|jgi:hypothetical protein|nr:hypothetical protein [Usitatibacter sp.]